MRKIHPVVLIITFVLVLGSVLLVSRRTGAMRLPYKFEETVDGLYLADLDKAMYTLSMRLMFFPKKYPYVRALGKVLAKRGERDIDSLTIYNDDYWKSFFVMAPRDPSVYFARIFLMYRSNLLHRTRYLLLMASYHMDREKQENKIITSSLQDTIRSVIARNDRIMERARAALDNKNQKLARQQFKTALSYYANDPRALYEIGRLDSEPDRDMIRYALRNDPFNWRYYTGSRNEMAHVVTLKEVVEPALDKLEKYEYENNELARFGKACMDLGLYEYAIYALWNHAILNLSDQLSPESAEQIAHALKLLGCLDAADFFVTETGNFNRLTRVKGIKTVTDSTQKK